MMGGVTGAMAQQQPATTGLRGNASDTYVMNVMVSGVEYWFPVYEMMKQLGRTLGVKTRYSGTPEYDVNKQLASFEQELARKPAGILLHPMNPDPFIEPINRAAAMGIPVVTFVQLLTDMMTATLTPTGHGHVYAARHYLDGWVAVTSPPLADAATLDRLRAWFTEQGI